MGETASRHHPSLNASLDFTGFKLKRTTERLAGSFPDPTIREQMEKRFTRVPKAIANQVRGDPGGYGATEGRCRSGRFGLITTAGAGLVRWRVRPFFLLFLIVLSCFCRYRGDESISLPFPRSGSSRWAAWTGFFLRH